MSVIYPFSTSRASDQLFQSRLLIQLQYDQLELLRLQEQVSTGRRISRPSDDAPAALRAIELQRLLEQKEQVKTSLNTGNSYLTATEEAISGASELLIDVRGAAVSAADSSSSDAQRTAAAEQVRFAIEQLASIGNQTYRGRYLFGGAQCATAPFETFDGLVAYHGDSNLLQTYADVDLLFGSNVPGDDVFGGISTGVQGSADWNPILTAETRLTDLHSGAGVSLGSFTISDGESRQTIDISSAETIGDVVRLIESNPPEGRQVTVSIAGDHLEVSLDEAGGGSLQIREVGQGDVAAELGILETSGAGVGPIIGQDLDPRLRLTTRLSDVLGGGFDQASGIQIVHGGQTQVVTFEGAETVEDVLNILNGLDGRLLAEINEAGTGINVRSRISGADLQIGENGGDTASQMGLRSFTRETRLDELNYGQGVETAEGGGADFVIRRRDGFELAVDISSARTIGDVIDLINSHPDNLDPLTSVTAGLASTGNGIELVDDNPAGTGELTVVREFGSHAAWGLGLISQGEEEAQAAAASPGTLVGGDVNPLETKGMFNSLIRLHAALVDFDLNEIERALELFDEDFERIDFSRAELGSRQQNLDAVQRRLEDEDVELRSNLSLEIDADLTEVISDLTARQTALEASLRLIANTMQVSLMDFI